MLTKCISDAAARLDAYAQVVKKFVVAFGAVDVGELACRTVLSVHFSC